MSGPFGSADESAELVSMEERAIRAAFRRERELLARVAALEDERELMDVAIASLQKRVAELECREVES